MKTLTFFNNKGGVGKTSLVYHLAWMFRNLGLTVVAADLDPQANLTAMFLDEAELEGLWPEKGGGPTILGPLRPLLEGTGGITDPEVLNIEDIGLLAGDLALSRVEDELSQQWPGCLDGQPRSFRVLGGFHEVLARAAESREADLVLIDVGPNLGAINRAALIASDHVVIPLAPDLFSLRGLQNLGPTLREWRLGWRDRLARAPREIRLPSGSMEPIGYIVLQHAVRLDRPVKAYGRWMDRIPGVYREAVLDQPGGAPGDVEDDPLCLAMLRHYRSLMPLAQEARKPMFSLTAADGAVGGHVQAVRRCHEDFRRLALRIAGQIGLKLP